MKRLSQNWQKIPAVGDDVIHQLGTQGVQLTRQAVGLDSKVDLLQVGFLYNHRITEW